MQLENILAGDQESRQRKEFRTTKRLAGLAFSMAVLTASATAQTTVTTSGGTTNTVPVFTGSSTVGNSPISVPGSNVGIGTTSTPNATLDIESTSSATLRVGSESSYTGILAESYDDTDWEGSFWISRRARGTGSVPATVQMGDILGAFDLQG